MMDKKTYLQGYQNQKRKIIALNRELEELQSREISPCINITGMPGAHNKRDLSDYMVKYEKTISRIIGAKNEALNSLNEIEQTIECLEDETEKTILRLRYLVGLTWEEIGTEVMYTYQYVHIIHKKALEHLVIEKLM